MDFLAPEQACAHGLGACPTFLYQLGHPPRPGQALPARGKTRSEWLEICQNLSKWVKIEQFTQTVRMEITKIHIIFRQHSGQNGQNEQNLRQANNSHILWFSFFKIFFFQITAYNI